MSSGAADETEVGIVHAAAVQYATAGLSVIPIRQDGSKAPAVKSWKKFQTTAASTDEIPRLFDRPCGIAVIGGAVSGGLEILDIEAAAPADDLLAMIGEAAPGLLDRLPRVATPSGGLHLFYRCPGHVAGNQKLAEEDDEKGRARVLIETRGEGGYVLTYPSGRSCHLAGKPYELQHGKLSAIPEITPNHREVLLACARSFNSHVPRGRPESTPRNGDLVASGRPGDRYSASANVVDLLERHGWAVYRRIGDEVQLRRPGKKYGLSATWNRGGRRYLWVFSTSAEPFEAGRAYDGFGVYAHLEHGGDFKAAAKALSEEGYGDPPRHPIRDESSADQVKSTGELDLLQYPLTEAGAAERLVALRGEDMRYVREWRRWICWDDEAGRWRRDLNGQAERWALESLRAARAACRKYSSAALAPGTDPTKLEAALLRLETDARIGGVLSLARVLPGVTVQAEDLDADRHLLGVQNGVLDLRRGELIEPRRESLITKAAPVAYSPDATCLHWLSFLSRAMGVTSRASSSEIEAAHRRMAFLQTAVGYSLSGDVSAKATFCLFGPTNSGKTTFLEAVRYMLGDYAHQITIGSLLSNGRTSDNNAQADLADLQGVRFATTSEAEEGQRLSESKLKLLSQGQETKIKVARKYENPTTFYATHKLWLDSNDRPRIRATDDSVWRRLKPLGFEVSIPDDEIDLGLPAKLQQEGPGVLRWALEGFRLWQAGGLGDPPDVAAAREAWREECDPLADFLSDCCELDPDGSASFRALRERYDAFCVETGERFPLGPKAFVERLRGHGCSDTRPYINGKRTRVWRGVSLL